MSLCRFWFLHLLLSRPQRSRKEWLKFVTWKASEPNNRWFFFGNHDIFRDVSCGRIGRSYDRCLLTPGIKQKLKDEPKREDRHQIYFVCCSGLLRKYNVWLRFGHPQVLGENRRQHLQNKAVCGTGRKVGVGFGNTGSVMTRVNAVWFARKP